MRTNTIIAAAALGFAALATPAAAVNKVTNGSFETGTFSGWSQFGDTSFTGTIQGSFGCCAPTDGNWQAIFGPVSGFGGISQIITGGAGSYTVSFDMGNDSGAGNSVSFGGTTLLSNIPNQAFTHYSFTVTTAANPVLSFSFFNPPAYYSLDNVVVTSNVPEAATWAMLIAGFGLTGAVSRRRRTAVAA
ncbi:MAG: PEPxxWA-CTERM sorting domain-containing protein [Sphingomonadales bacterium]|jgi:hypothetical protein